MQFQRLPHEINKNIGSFLDYNSRMEFSRVLTSSEDRFVRKLNSDAHNFAVLVRKLKSYMDETISLDVTKQANACYKLFNYFANTKDTLLYDLVGLKEFRKAAINKATEFADINSVQYANQIDQKLKIKLLMSSSKALHRLKTYVPKNELNVKRQLIEII